MTAFQNAARSAAQFTATSNRLLAILSLPDHADTADVWAAGREHELRADAYAWHNLLSDPARSETEES